MANLTGNTSAPLGGRERWLQQASDLLASGPPVGEPAEKEAYLQGLAAAVAAQPEGAAHDALQALLVCLDAVHTGQAAPMVSGWVHVVNPVEERLHQSEVTADSTIMLPCVTSSLGIHLAHSATPTPWLGCGVRILVGDTGIRKGIPPVFSNTGTPFHKTGLLCTDGRTVYFCPFGEHGWPIDEAEVALDVAPGLIVGTLTFVLQAHAAALPSSLHPS